MISDYDDDYFINDNKGDNDDKDVGKWGSSTTPIFPPSNTKLQYLQNW